MWVACLQNTPRKEEAEMNPKVPNITLIRRWITASILLPGILSCQDTADRPAVYREQCVRHGNDSIEMFTMTNAGGMSVRVTNFAASLADVQVPDKNGLLESVVLGFDSVQSYLGSYPKFGNTIGRYAGRINQGEIMLDGQHYELEKNAQEYAMHGGTRGFNRQLVHTDTCYIRRDTSVVAFSYRSPHLEGGFPGTLDVTVTYRLTRDNKVIIDYAATTDQPTVLNLTNHSYFNLDGNPQHNNSDWLLTINADYFTPVDNTFMTSGELRRVDGTPMDFRSAASIGDRICQNYEQLQNANGIDHNWVLSTKGDLSKIAATLKSPESGIRLDVYTTEPGIQVYCGNFLVGNKYDGVVEFGFHLVGIGDHIGAGVASVELHTFHDGKFGKHRFGFVNGDNAVFTDFFHSFADKFADLFVSGGNTRHACYLVLFADFLADCFQFFHGFFRSFEDTFA